MASGVSTFDAGVGARTTVVGLTPVDAGVRVVATVMPTTGAYVGGPTAERERALSSSMVEKWRYFLSEQQKIEGDADWVSGFLASRELRDCRCPLPRPVPGEMVRRLDNNDRLPQLQQDDERNTRCELCRAVGLRPIGSHRWRPSQDAIVARGASDAPSQRCVRPVEPARSPHASYRNRRKRSRRSRRPAIRWPMPTPPNGGAGSSIPMKTPLHS
jgi:hypothetical protein